MYIHITLKWTKSKMISTSKNRVSVLMHSRVGFFFLVEKSLLIYLPININSLRFTKIENLRGVIRMCQGVDT